MTALAGGRPDAGRGSHTTHTSLAAVAWLSQGDAAGSQRVAWRRAGLPHHLGVRHDLEEDVRVQVRELGRTAEVLAELLVDIDNFHRGLCCVGECAGRRPFYALAHPSLHGVATVDVDVGKRGAKLNRRWSSDRVKQFYPEHFRSKTFCSEHRGDAGTGSARRAQAVGKMSQSGEGAFEPGLMPSHPPHAVARSGASLPRMWSPVPRGAQRHAERRERVI